MKKFVKIYSIITLCFTALSLIAGVIDFVIKSVRELTERGTIASSISVTGSSLETASHWLANLWIAPVTAIVLRLSLIIAFTWLYINFKAVKSGFQKFGRDFLGYE